MEWVGARKSAAKSRKEKILGYLYVLQMPNQISAKSVRKSENLHVNLAA
jgi:hypothetical protein